MNQRQAAQVAVLADRMSRLEVKQTGRESDVTTVEGAGLAIAEWPSTFGLRPLGDRHLSRLRPSSRLIIGQFVSLLVSTRRLAQLPVRSVWFTLLGEFCQTMH